MVAGTPLKAGGRRSPAADAHPGARCRLGCWRPVIRPRQRNGMGWKLVAALPDTAPAGLLSGPEIEILNLWSLWRIILIAPLSCSGREDPPGPWSIVVMSLFSRVGTHGVLLSPFNFSVRNLRHKKARKHLAVFGPKLSIQFLSHSPAGRPAALRPSPQFHPYSLSLAFSIPSVKSRRQIQASRGGRDIVSPIPLSYKLNNVCNAYPRTDRDRPAPRISAECAQ